MMCDETVEIYIYRERERQLCCDGARAGRENCAHKHFEGNRGEPGFGETHAHQTQDAPKGACIVMCEEARNFA